METLHSYWRMEYLNQLHESEEDKNPFVYLPQIGDDKKALIVYRSTHVYLVLNKYPYNPGHLLLVPYKEKQDISDLSEEEYSDFMQTLLKGKKILEKTFHPDGMNIGINLGSAAGAGIPQHLHCHIVPRWEKDTNFMPVIGKTRVLAQALEETWERLRSFC